MEPNTTSLAMDVSTKMMNVRMGIAMEEFTYSRISIATIHTIALPPMENGIKEYATKSESKYVLRGRGR
jgi:hypothetical protein